MDNKGTEHDIREFLPSPLLEKPIASDVIAESGAVFVKLLQYFPESADKELYARVLDYSTLCLASGDFANAENYARMVLAQDDDGKRSAEATLLLLFAKLKCRTYDEFLHCTEFADNMPEYRDVIKAYSINSDAMGCAIALSRANAATVAHDKEVEAARLAAEAARIAAEKQREAERIAEEARRREEAARQAALEEEKRKLLRKARALQVWSWAALAVGCVFMLAAIVVWGIEGEFMPYTAPWVAALFAVAVICFAASVFIIIGMVRSKLGYLGGNTEE